jgi:hypothetical protein
MSDAFRPKDAFSRAAHVGSVPPVGHPPSVPDQTKQQSGFGMTSFVLAIVATLAHICTVVAVAIDVAVYKNSDKTLDNLMTVTFLVSGSVGTLVAVFGLALGITNLFQPGRMKVFGILGTVLNGLFVLGALSCVCLGLLAVLS